MTAIHTVPVPRRFVELAESWHGGQDGMLYAVSSTGGLTPGTHRPSHPDEDRPMDDDEWLASLWGKLASELRENVAWMAEHPLPDADFDDPARELAGLRAFLAFAETAAEHIRDAQSGDTGPLDLESMVIAYVEAALWSTMDESDESGGEPMDAHYGLDDIDPETMEQMRTDCAEFLEANRQHIGDDFERAGHDFWLTRNGHGAGFWDGDWPEPQATTLTERAHAMGAAELHIGDDGKIHGY